MMLRLTPLRYSAAASPAACPTAQPEADLVYPGKHLLELVKIGPVPGIGDPPRKGCGVRIFWGLMGEPSETDRFRLASPPLTGRNLPRSTFTHRKRFRFDFEGDSGRTVWFCLRYENAKGGKEEGGRAVWAAFQRDNSLTKGPESFLRPGSSAAGARPGPRESATAARRGWG